MYIKSWESWAPSPSAQMFRGSRLLLLQKGFQFWACFCPWTHFSWFPFLWFTYHRPTLLWQDLKSVLLVKYHALLPDVEYEGITSKQCKRNAISSYSVKQLLSWFTVLLGLFTGVRIRLFWGLKFSWWLWYKWQSFQSFPSRAALPWIKNKIWGKKWR